MLILPAIDLLEGRCVRLRQGRFDEATIYSDDPVDVAQGFVEGGAQALHIVDLDGARSGTARNTEWVRRIRDSVPVMIQVGGGVRTFADAEGLLDVGVDRVVLGTAAVENPDLIGRLLDAMSPGKIAAGSDLRDGKLAVRGWVEESDRALPDFLGQLRHLGLRHLVCTDVNRDGILVGPSYELITRMSDEGFDVTIAGGVATPEDIRRVRQSGATACIIGKALYSGMLSLGDALEAARVD